MVNIQQKSEAVNFSIDNLKMQNIENEILRILNDNKVTSEEFDTIIDNLIKQKSSAYLTFIYNKEKHIKEYPTCDGIVSTIDKVPIKKESNLWY